MAIKNMGTATMRFKQGLFVEGGTDVHGQANQLVTTGSISVMGTGIANTYSAAPSNGTYDRTEWYYIPGNVQVDTNTSYEPRTPSSPVPVDDGTTTNSAFYTFWGGNIHVSNVERMISLKTGVSGTVTISFKIIAGGNNDGSGSNNSSVTQTIPLANSTTTPSNFAHPNRTWTSGTSNHDSPVQIAYATTGFEQSANWTAVSGGTSSNFRGHYNSHPNAADQNLNVQECTSVSYTITGISGTFYVGIIQDDNGPNYNSWAITDLVVEEGFDQGYINFEGSSFSEGSDGFGFRNNAGAMEFKDEGSDWKPLSETVPGGHNRAIQFNNEGGLDGGNFFYGSNARIGIGDFTQDGNPAPDYLLTIRGDAGGSGENGYVNIVEHNDATGPAILYQRYRGSLASPTDIQDDDILGSEVFIGQVGSSLQILGAQTTRYHSTNGSNIVFSLKGQGDPGSTNKLLMNGVSLMPHPDITTSNKGAYVLGGGTNAYDTLYCETLQGPQGMDMKVVADNNDVIMYIGTQGTYANNVGIGNSTPEYPLVVQGTHTTDPDVHIRNSTTNGPVLDLSRVVSSVGDIELDETIAKIQMGVDAGSIADGANIITRSTSDWNDPLINPISPNRYTQIAFQTLFSANTDFGPGNLVISDRLTIDHDKVHCINNDLEVDGAVSVGTDLTVNSDCEVDFSVSIGTTLAVNKWISKNPTSTVGSTVELAEYTDGNFGQSNNPMLTFNSGENHLKVQYRDTSGFETFRLDPDGKTYIGTTNGSPQYSAYDVYPSNGSLYVEGFNDDGCVLKVVNRSTDDTSDGIEIICGFGSYQRQGHSSPLHFNTATNSWIRFLEKKRSYALTQSEDETADPPDSVRVASTISGNGSGGVTYHTSFTGAHCCVIKGSSDVVVGMILSSTGEIWLKNTENVSTSLPYVQLSTSKNDKTVFGVASSLSSHQLGYKDAGQIPDTDTYLEANGIGEGSVWITNIDGEPTNGDYITTSPIRGYGQMQSDDILRSYTVAKLTEAIDWSSVTETISHEGATYKKYLAACTYHCG